MRYDEQECGEMSNNIDYESIRNDIMLNRIYTTLILKRDEKANNTGNNGKLSVEEVIEALTDNYMSIFSAENVEEKPPTIEDRLDKLEKEIASLSTQIALIGYKDTHDWRDRNG